MALRLSGVSPDLLNHIKSNMPGYYVKRKILTKITEILNMKIRLHRCDDKELDVNGDHRVRHVDYGDGPVQLNLATFKSHIFPLDETNYTYGCMENPESRNSPDQPEPTYFRELTHVHIIIA